MRKRAAKPRQDALPAFVEPCLATLVAEPPSGPEWVHEIKFDGYRLEARVDNGEAQLLTRSGLDWTGRFSGVAKALSALPAGSALIDGEAVVEDERGVTSFIELVKDLKAGESGRIVYFAFDLLYLDGESLVGLPLLERKEHLARLLKSARKNGRIRLSEHLAGDGRKMLAESCKLGLEGIISKRADLPYRPGRRDDWLKSKCVASDEFVIGGYLDSAPIKNAVGALVVGYYERGRLVYAGRVGTGYSRRTAGELWRTLQPLRIATPPFQGPLDADQRRGVQWVEPKLVAQIDYRAWTGDRLLRHAAFKALREDKPAREVRRPKMK